MRLPAADIERIKAIARQVYGARTVVRLFGSRVDDRLRGGDIDLHLTVPAARAGFDRELEFRRLLEDALGEQKIDVIVHGHDAPLTTIDEIAIAEGQVL